MTLNGRTVLVTGGGRGIGQAIAIACAEAGADVVVAARSVDELNETVKQVEAAGRKGLAIQADLGNRSAIADFIDAVKSQSMEIDILVNNAGIGSSANAKLIVDYDDDFWELSVTLNLTAPYLLTKAFLPGMIEKGWGRVINISSVLGKMGYTTAAAYTATKHGLIGLTRTAALETATTGVTVNAICPGPIRTPMLEKRLQITADGMNVPVAEVVKTMTPMQRILNPEDVAGLCVYLASDLANGITGQSCNISGGMVMH